MCKYANSRLYFCTSIGQNLFSYFLKVWRKKVQLAILYSCTSVVRQYTLFFIRNSETWIFVKLSRLFGISDVSCQHRTSIHPSHSSFLLVLLYSCPSAYTLFFIRNSETWIFVLSYSDFLAFPMFHASIGLLFIRQTLVSFAVAYQKSVRIVPKYRYTYTI